jgi:ribosomal-protein-alanine N-acetyltransferase
MARELGAMQMYLEVRASNNAAKYLYYRAGFNEVGLRKNYYQAKKGREDAVVFAKELVV